MYWKAVERDLWFFFLFSGLFTVLKKVYTNFFLLYLITSYSSFIVTQSTNPPTVFNQIPTLFSPFFLFLIQRKIRRKFFVIEKLIIPDQNCINFISFFVGFYSNPQLNLWKMKPNRRNKKNKIDLLLNFCFIVFNFYCQKRKRKRVDNVLLSTLFCNQHCGLVDLCCLIHIFNSFVFFLLLSIWKKR